MLNLIMQFFSFAFAAYPTAGMDSCQSTGDPHIVTFGDHQKYDSMAVGNFWLAKSTDWDCQVHQDGVKHFNNKVGIRYKKSIWVATIDSKSLTCVSGNCVQIDIQTFDGKAVAKLPNDCEISLTFVGTDGLDVSVTVPGQDVASQAASLCNPGRKITAPLTDNSFAVNGGSYFDNPTAIGAALNVLPSVLATPIAPAPAAQPATDAMPKAY